MAREYKLVRKRNYGIIVAIVAILLLLALSNPGSGDFEAYMRREARSSVTRDAGSGTLGNLLGGIAETGSGLVARGAYTRSNLLFASVYSQRGRSPTRYLGFAKVIFVKIAGSANPR
jgi:hypothetical protein